MNLVVRGIDGQIAHGDTLHDDRRPDLNADSIPAFNISDWGGDLLKNGRRWQYGLPPADRTALAAVARLPHLPSASPNRFPHPGRMAPGNLQHAARTCGVIPDSHCCAEAQCNNGERAQ
jgi:hypothetical protein